MVDIVVIKPFGVADGSLNLKPQAFGNSAAAGVPDSDGDGDAVEAQLSEGMVDKHPAATGHDPFAGRLGGEPIADID